MLTAEMSHRVKNASSVAQALASQTARSSGSLEQFREAFLKRLSAYSRSHNLLLDRDWRAGELGDLIRGNLLLHAGNAERVDIDGSPLRLAPSRALALGLILHELETNAVKYGAFSNDSGRVEIRWAVDGEEVDLLGRAACPGFHAHLSLHDGDDEPEILRYSISLICPIGADAGHIEELRNALPDFQQTYNEEWLIERHGHRTPAAIRREQTMNMQSAA